MAKNDKKKMQSQVNNQVGAAQNNLNVTNDFIRSSNQDFKNRYDDAVPMQMQDYRDIMDSYKSYLGGLPGGASGNNRVSAREVSYNRTPEMQHALSGYGEFADTGGFSEDDKTNLRSRALSPVQTVYNNLRNEMERRKNIQGGYSPNFNAAAAKMGRGTAQQMSDILQGTNATIAEMVQKGRLSGLGGLGQLATADTGFGQDAQLANQRAFLEADLANQRMSAYDPRLQALGGMQSLFGTRPGMAGLFGDQMLASQDQMLTGQGYQNQIGQMGIQGQNMVSQTPSNFETVMRNVGNIGGMIGSVGAGIMGLPGINRGITGGGSPQYMPQAGPINQAYNPVGQVSYPRRNMVSLG